MDKFAKALLDTGSTTLATLLVRHYHALGMSNDEFLVYLQLKSFFDQGIDFPPASQVAEALSWSEKQVFEVLHQMIEKKLMQIRPAQKNDQLTTDAYDFSLMFEKLSQLQQGATSAEPTTKRTKKPASEERQTVFQQVEQEFGRPLSPIELETISQWLDTDHYNPALIQLALKEAVLNQVYNLKYMDRILLSWERKNLKTASQVQQDKNRRNTDRDSPKNSSTKAGDLPDIPLFNIGDQPHPS